MREAIGVRGEARKDGKNRRMEERRSGGTDTGKERMKEVNLNENHKERKRCKG